MLSLSLNGGDADEPSFLSDGDYIRLTSSPGGRALPTPAAGSSPKASSKAGLDEQPPFSLQNEVRFFFSKGLPLGLSSFLEWGLPPLFAMYFAGQTDESAELQQALGYGRVFFNITILMPTLGMFAYYRNVVPGCLGAGREDRIPLYFRRSMLLETLILLPLYVLQFFSGPIMESALGASPAIGAQVQTYTRLMVVPAFLILLECHVETFHVNCGYARCATLNSLLTGLGVDVATSYCLVYRLELGVFGAALTQIVVKASRLLVWGAVMTWFGLWGDLVWGRTESARAEDRAKGRVEDRAGDRTDRGGGGGGDREPLLSWREWRVFCRLGFPSVVSFFSGWFIFELQLMLMAHIDGISDAALAAGAVWVTLESTLSAVQDGWIQVCSMRVMVLLGRVDPGAPRSYLVLCALSAAVVLLTNAPLLACSGLIATAMSSDPEVQGWLAKIVWVLALHSQIRITSIQSTFLLIPMGKPWVKIASTLVAFYFVASPIAAAVVLTDVATSDVGAKMAAAVGCTSIGMLANGIFGAWYMSRLDWLETGRVVQDRANTDKAEAAALVVGRRGAAVAAGQEEQEGTALQEVLASSRA